MIRQFPHCLPFSIGTVLLCSGRLCSTGTAFSLASKMFNLLLDILTEYSLLNACQEFCLLFLLYFFLVLKYCFKSPWQNSPLKPSGCPFLVLLPRTCCSSVGCPGLGLASAFLCSEVFPFFFFMSLWRSERNQGSIYNHLRVITGCHIWVYFQKFYEITFTSCKALMVKFKGFAERKCLHLNCLF